MHLADAFPGGQAAALGLRQIRTGIELVTLLEVLVSMGHQHAARIRPTDILAFRMRCGVPPFFGIHTYREIGDAVGLSSTGARFRMLKILRRVSRPGVGMDLVYAHYAQIIADDERPNR